MIKQYHHRIYLPTDAYLPVGDYILSKRDVNNEELLPDIVSTKNLSIVELTLTNGKVSAIIYRMNLNDDWDVIFKVNRMFEVHSIIKISRGLSYYSLDDISNYGKF